MTREQSKKEIKEHEQSIPYGEWGVYGSDCEYIIDEIFDYFENRTCENCKHCSDIISSSCKCDLFECYQQKALKHCGNWQLKNE